MKTLCALFILLVSLPVFSYQEGTFTCKNTSPLPDTTYKISTQSLGVGGPSVPYVDMKSYYTSEETGKVVEVHISGLAFDSQVENESYLTLGNIHIEFSGTTFLNCDKSSRH
jgi:hypothetical protein